MVGRTRSANFPLAQPLSKVVNGTGETFIGDAFVAKISAAGDRLLFSSYLGGRSEERGTSIAAPDAQTLIVVGYAYSDNFPLLHPLQNQRYGAVDAFITRIGQVPSVPFAPAGEVGELSAVTVSGHSLRVAWNDRVDGEDAFEIERDSGAGFAYRGEVGANVTAFLDEGLLPLTSYTYRVRARNLGGYTAYSNAAAATTAGVPPAAPSQLQVVSVEERAVTLRWRDNSDDEVAFQVELAQGETFDQFFSAPSSPGSPLQQARITGLEPNSTYRLRVVAYNLYGNSQPSGVVEILTLPPVPFAVTVQPLSATRMRVQWAGDGGVPAESQVEISRDGGASYVPLARVPAGEFAWEATGLSASTTYWFRVRSVNATGTSSASEPAHGTTWTVAQAGRLEITPRGILGQSRTVNLGSVRVGKKGQKSIQLKNTGRGPLQVRITNAQAPFQTPNAARFNLLPGKSYKLLIEFRPTIADTAEGGFLIESDDPSPPGQRVEIHLKGKGQGKAR